MARAKPAAPPPQFRFTLSVRVNVHHSKRSRVAFESTDRFHVRHSRFFREQKEEEDKDLQRLQRK